MTKKYCVRCKQEKNINEFHKNKSEKDGHARWCASCFNGARRKEYRNVKREHDRQYYLKNSEIIRTNTNKYYHEHKKERNAYKKAKRKNNLNYKIAEYLRGRITKAIKGNWKAGSAVKDLGCSIEGFKVYIANKFTEGMSWNNYGEWHLDHIFPLTIFDLTKRKQFLSACHYTNYQPLWAKDNKKKHTKIISVPII